MVDVRLGQLLVRVVQVVRVVHVVRVVLEVQVILQIPENRHYHVDLDLLEGQHHQVIQVVQIVQVVRVVQVVQVVLDNIHNNLVHNLLQS